MMRRRFLLSALLTPISVRSAVASTRDEPDDNSVIATERRALDRWIKGDPDGYLEIYTDEITYFDPKTAHRVDGRPAMTAWLAPVRGKVKIHRYEMLNPKVQRYGEIAVLTYNIVNYQLRPNGTEYPTTRWNSTAVFRRVGTEWRTIHSHFSYTTPELKQ
jgi:ketosteroid isomerase-like protein